jgi:hypothetical protein
VNTKIRDFWNVLSEKQITLYWGNMLPPPSKEEGEDRMKP